jgi:hypothetical protein
MNCTTCQEHLPEYQERGLPQETTEAVRQHLAACADCRQQQQRDTELLAATRALPRTRPRPEVILITSSKIHAAAPAQARTDFGPVLDIHDLAEYLRVEPDLLENYVEEIPHFELGGRLLFRRVAVETWIAEREQASTLAAGPSRWSAAEVLPGVARFQLS